MLTLIQRLGATHYIHRSTSPSPHLPYFQHLRQLHQEVYDKLHACCDIRNHESGTMAQHNCAKDKLNRSGRISLTDLDLLCNRRLEGPRFRWQQDTGRARCGANDCLGLSAMANTRYIFKGEILGVFWGSSAHPWRKGEKPLSRLEFETVVYS